MLYIYAMYYSYFLGVKYNSPQAIYYMQGNMLYLWQHDYLPVHTGSSLLHTPSIRQLLTLLPINSNVLLHV